MKIKAEGWDGNRTTEFSVEGAIDLRDYLAASCAKAIDPPQEFVGEEYTQQSYDKWARKAYKMADALLKARG